MLRRASIDLKYCPAFHSRHGKAGARTMELDPRDNRGSSCMAARAPGLRHRRAIACGIRASRRRRRTRALLGRRLLRRARRRPTPGAVPRRSLSMLHSVLFERRQRACLDRRDRADRSGLSGSELHKACSMAFSWRRKQAPSRLDQRVVATRAAALFLAISPPHGPI